MVQITRVRVQGSEEILRADTFGFSPGAGGASPQKNDDHVKTCLCPDPKCNGRLVHVKAYQQTYYVPGRNGSPAEALTLKIAPHFRRHPKSPPHAENCEIALAYHRYADEARLHGAHAIKDVGFVYNLNVLTDNHPAPRRGLARNALNGAAAQAYRTHYAQKAGYTEKRPPLSQGINNIRMLGQLLSDTAFDEGLRTTSHMRRNGAVFTLAEMYNDDSVALFRQKYKEAKAFEHGARHIPMPILYHFRPILTPKANGLTFWDAKNLTVIGLARPEHDMAGNLYSVSVRLKFGDAALYKDFIKQMRSGEKSFLVYDDKASVDLDEFAATKAAICEGGKKHGVFVDMHVNCAGQMMVWAPPRAQMDLTRYMDMPPVLPPTCKTVANDNPAPKKREASSDAQLKFSL